MNVRYRARALEDVHAIHQWRARQSADVAEKVEAAIFAAVDWLGEHSKFGSKTDEVNVRRWPMTDFRYTIFYVIDREADAIDVLRDHGCATSARPEAGAAMTLYNRRIA